MMNHRSNSLKQNILISVPALLLLAAIAFIETTVVGQTGRVFYPIDDPYIHMAMARHFAEDGVFGVSKAGFSATSSSPLWTLLLGVFYKIAGPRDFIPLALNIVFGTAAMFYLTKLLANRLKSAAAAAVVGTLLLLVLPMPTLVALGMEHTLHILLILMLVKHVADVATSESGGESIGGVVLLTFLAMLARFETVFVAAPLFLFCVSARRWKTALAIAASCAAPLLALGAINVHNGWYFFPTSVKLKSALSQHGWERVDTVVKRLYGQLFGTPHIVTTFLLGCAAFFTAWMRDGWLKRNTVWAAVFVVATVLHCSLASIGWFYRYEGYLLAVGAVAFAPLAKDAVLKIVARFKQVEGSGERWTACAALAGTLVLLPFPYYNQYKSIPQLVPAARNIYSQQVQMGLFLREFYQGRAVLANDIGAINYLADIVCLDVMGLGSVEPIRAKTQGFWNPRFLHSWCAQHKTPIAIVYQSWLGDLIPPTWIKVGEWTVSEKVSVADSTVSFYALTPPEAESLRANLKTFETKLPEGVTSKILNPTK